VFNPPVVALRINGSHRGMSASHASFPKQRGLLSCLGAAKTCETLDSVRVGAVSFPLPHVIIVYHRYTHLQGFSQKNVYLIGCDHEKPI
jgi:hypothetical protein